MASITAGLSARELNVSAGSHECHDATDLGVTTRDGLGIETGLRDLEIVLLGIGSCGIDPAGTKPGKKTPVPVKRHRGEPVYIVLPCKLNTGVTYNTSKRAYTEASGRGLTCRNLSGPFEPQAQPQGRQMMRFVTDQATYRRPRGAGTHQNTLHRHKAQTS